MKYIYFISYIYIKLLYIYIYISLYRCKTVLHLTREMNDWDGMEDRIFRSEDFERFLGQISIWIWKLPLRMTGNVLAKKRTKELRGVTGNLLVTMRRSSWWWGQMSCAAKESLPSKSFPPFFQSQGSVI